MICGTKLSTIRTNTVIRFTPNPISNSCLNGVKKLSENWDNFGFDLTTTYNAEDNVPNQSQQEALDIGLLIAHTVISADLSTLILMRHVLLLVRSLIQPIPVPQLMPQKTGTATTQHLPD